MTVWVVTCTVVSVMPNMFTSRHRSCGSRRNHSSRDRTSSGSPPKITRRRASDCSWFRWTSRSEAKAEGVWLSTVTRRWTSSAWNSSGERETQYGTTTRWPPVSRQPQISHTEKSKELEWNSVHTSSGPSRMSSVVAAMSAPTLRWGTTTPLGLPVEPEV